MMYHGRGSEVSPLASQAGCSLASGHSGPCIAQVSMGWHSGQGTNLGVTMDKSLSFEGLLQKPSTCRCSADRARPSGELGLQTHSLRARGESEESCPWATCCAQHPVLHSQGPLPCVRVCRWEPEAQVGSLLRREALSYWALV